jgi:hypothetical protein
VKDGFEVFKGNNKGKEVNAQHGSYPPAAIRMSQREQTC